MRVRYEEVEGHLEPYYQCTEAAVRRAGKLCQSVRGRPIDEAISALLVESVAPAAAILRPARTPKGSEVRTVIKHVTKRLRRHWPKTRMVWRGDSHYGRVEAMEWAEEHDADYIFGLANAALDALAAETAVNLRFCHAISSTAKLRTYGERISAVKKTEDGFDRLRQGLRQV